MKTPETIVKDAVCKYLTNKHIWFRRYQAQYNAYGLPDLDFLYKGVYVGLELKAEKGTPTELQLRKIKSINENGGIGVIAKSVDDVIDVVKFIDENETNYIKHYRNNNNTGQD